MQGRELYVGTFPTESSAAKAHDVAALRLQREDTAAPQVELCPNAMSMLHQSMYVCMRIAQFQLGSQVRTG